MREKINGNMCDYEVVISGISGRFAESRNINEFESNLHNKVNLVNDNEVRFAHSIPSTPKFSGKIPDLEKFDATMFGIHKKKADDMDPMARILLEEAYKAIMDAGVNPVSLSGTNTGVYIGTSTSETATDVFYNLKESTLNNGMVGCCKSMFSNRISYVLGLNGPSLICDTACSSSIYSIDLALKAFRNGEIDAAIVGGANLNLHPKITLQFNLLGILSKSGLCRPFDQDADGYVRSEAISCIFLQRKSAAKRVYGTLVHSKTNCDGFKQEGITYPSAVIQEKLLRQIYDEAKINLDDIGYMEAHCTATIVGDPEECKAIDNAICSRRTEPLYVGSVKANCGHAEPAAGMCSVAKAVVAMNSGVIPPIINFTKNRQIIDALIKGRMKVVSESTKLLKPYVGVNSFGFGGANAHVLFKQHDKVRTTNGDDDKLYRLVTWAGRVPETIYDFFKKLESQPLDPEYLALVQGAHEGGIKCMTYRGYSVLKPISNECAPKLLNKRVEHWSGLKRPLVWVFNGVAAADTALLGGIAKSLLQFQLFQQSIQRSHNTLKPTGLDLIQILTTTRKNDDENILHAFVTCAAIQIALVDLLTELGLTPDILIGHSVGELGCAYADNCLTAEQTILTSFYYGKVCLEMNKIKGAMAVVALSGNAIKSQLPKALEVAHYNSRDSCSVVGPREEIMTFLTQLKSQNIYAKEIQCSGIAQHSSYIAHFAPHLLKYLKHIIPTPKLRSSKWLSTSCMSTNDANKYASAEYHTNNFLSSVNFEEAGNIVPQDALTIEITPQTLVQGSLLKLFCTEGIHMELGTGPIANATDSTALLLQSLGSLYLNGFDLRVDKLYSPVSFPVSRGVQNLSSLINFDHNEDHYVYRYKDSSGTGWIEFNVQLTDENLYLQGHEIDGRVLAPATFYLECVWRTFSTMVGQFAHEMISVEFENVKFERATTLTTNGLVELAVVIHRGTGHFEITESSSLIVSGVVRQIQDKDQPAAVDPNDNASQLTLGKKDFYKELKLRGYHYNGDFQAVELSTADGSYGKIKWAKNWVTFMDCMLQLGIIGQDSRTLMLPTSLRTLRIYPEYHKRVVNDNALVEVFSNAVERRLVAGGIEIIGLDASAVQRRRAAGEPVLEKYQFVPHFPSPKLCLDDIARCCIQLVLENQPRSKLQIVDIKTTTKQNNDFLEGLMQAIGDLPLIAGNYTIVNTADKMPVKDTDLPQNVTQLYAATDDYSSLSGNIVVIDSGFSENNEAQSTILKKMDSLGFVILSSNKLQAAALSEYVEIARFPAVTAADGTFVLLKRKENASYLNDLMTWQIPSVNGNDSSCFKWLEEVQALCKKSKNVLLYGQNDCFNGILGLVNCLRKEPDTKNVRCVFIDKNSKHKFDVNSPFFRDQLQLGLGINILQNNNWGTYRHLQLSLDSPATTHSNHVYGNIIQVGDLSSLKWFQGPLTQQAHEVRIMYSSLNFKDVMQASGRLPIATFGKSRLGQTCIFGFEYSGINLANKKPIMGMTFQGAVSSHLSKPPALYWNVPETWTLKDAATVPVVYLTVYYAFFYTADIRRGKSILIHAGSGGVGLAAIRVAQSYGLEVYTTVSSVEKKAYLLRTFPTLNDNNIGYSRDTSFEEMIMDRTKGQGVDFVLNSLSEDKLKASLRCLGKGGHFMEIGKFDMANNNDIDLAPFLNELTFHAVLADNLLEANESLVEAIKQHMRKDIENGIIRPLPVTVFAANEIEKAFRYLMSGKHIGKVLLQIREKPESNVTLPISVLPQIYYSPDLVYVVPGGLGGFGLELVDLMILRGARKIVLSSSRGITNDYQKLRISLWQNYGCDILINISDIGTEKGCLELLTAAMKLGPVGGIFNLAVVLRDLIFPNQTVELFQQSFAPKAYATKYLDQISRKLCPKLQHFVIFSSVSCGRGNAGQTNYGMANSIMERIIEDRVAHGLPGKAVQWGAVGEVGLVAEMAAGKIDLEIGGTLQQRISSCLDVLDALLSTPDPIVASMVVAEKKANSAGQTPIDFVLNTLSIRDIKSVSMNSTLAELGMDSLMSVEIRQAFERDYDLTLNASDLRSLTFVKLLEISENFASVGGNTNGDQQDQSVVTETDSMEYLRQFYGDQMANLSDINLIFDRVNNITNGDPIIIIPGIDGCSGKVWHKIGEGVKAPTYVLQFHQTVNAKSIDAIADFATKNIIELLEKNKTKKFQIVAYSLGTMVAHYTLKLLEDKGYKGKVILIDGSPLWVQAVVTSLKQIHAENEFEKVSLAMLLSVILPKLSVSTILSDWRYKFSKEEWFCYINDNLRESNYADFDDTMISIEAIYNRLKIIQDPETYKDISVLNAEILILKPKIETVSKLDEFYGLSPFTKNVIHTEVLEGNHQTILYCEKLSDIINKYFN